MDRKTCLENLINDYLIETYPYIIGVCDISLSKINDRMSVHMIMKLNNQKVKNIIGNDLYGTIFSENKVKDLEDRLNKLNEEKKELMENLNTEKDNYEKLNDEYNQFKNVDRIKFEV